MHLDDEGNRGRATAVLTRRPISWEEHEHGIWVGRAGGADVALIEAVEAVFVPSIPSGGALGVCPSLTVAQKSVEVRLRPRRDWGAIVMHGIGAVGLVAAVIGVVDAIARSAG